MPHVIADPCVGVKDTACVDACPVDCIHSIEGANQYYIDPVTCIDCGACIPACPVAAIFTVETLPAEWKRFTAINTNFFKGFDKAKSTAYTRTSAQPGASPTADKTVAQSAEVSNDATWTEVPGWEKLWEERKNDPEDKVERDKRYGRVRSVFEGNDQYILRFFLPTLTPNHPFKYQYGLPDEMPTYTFRAEQNGNSVSIYARVTNPKVAKLAGFVNSFPDRFFVEYPFSKAISSVSIKTQGSHVVDVVVTKENSNAKVTT